MQRKNDKSNELTRISTFNEDGPIVITRQDSVHDMQDPYDFGSLTNKYLENDKFVAK